MSKLAQIKSLKVEKRILKLFLARILSMIIGIFLFAFGIIITIKANIGYAPWDVFHVGLANTTGLTLGVTSIIVGFILVILIIVFGEKLGLATFTNVMLIGIFIDIILKLDLIPIANNIIIGIIMLIIGLFIISLGTYFYIKAGFGTGPRDNLMVVLTRKTKLPVGICRCIVDILVLLIGWILGGMVGIGTLISVIAMGFCIQIVFFVFKFDVTSVKHESLKDTFIALANNLWIKK